MIPPIQHPVPRSNRVPSPILDTAAMRAVEARVIAGGTSADALMARAGAAAARAIARFTGPCPTLVLCGPGNNGGDGYVVATQLAAAGWPVRVATLGPSTADPARAARARWIAAVETFADSAPAPLVIDALFGIGLARPLAPDTAARLSALLHAARVRVALDVPSGVDADTGALLGATLRFDLTVTFGARKPAHLLHPAAALCGHVVVADIGVDAGTPDLFVNPAPTPQHLAPAGYKAQRGHVLVLGGGPGHGGAARLAARAALRAGAGLVTLAVPAAALTENAARLPDAIMLRPLDDPHALAALVTERRATVVALGPGLGTDPAARALAEAALALDLPLVLDADIFTLFTGIPKALERKPPIVLTPHESEFTRLFGPLPGPKPTRALAAAKLTPAVVLLKGPDTVIAAPDGRAAINHAAAPWLATAGSGDVLTGTVAARLASGEDAFAAAAAAAWLHARAGEAAGPGMTADDLPELLGQVVRDLARGYTPAQ